VNYSDIAESLMRTVMETRMGFIGHLDKFARGEVCALTYLARTDGTQLPSELSVALGCSTARVATLLGSLEKRGLIVREIDPSDRRQILVTITDAGRARARAAALEIRERTATILSALGERDAAEFARLLARVMEISSQNKARVDTQPNSEETDA
jgi:DNA-binding MarR family transcriptional regulator